MRMRRKFLLRNLCSYFLVCCMLFLYSIEGVAQNAITIKGQVLDANSNEPLIGVSVYEKKVVPMVLLLM